VNPTHSFIDLFIALMKRFQTGGYNRNQPKKRTLTVLPPAPDTLLARFVLLGLAGAYVESKDS
jgi:uncharacterized membrane protein SirB2